MTSPELSPVHQDLVHHVLEAGGLTTQAQRRAAFDAGDIENPSLKTLLEKVALNPNSITDEDFTALQASNLTEDQIFELVICAAVGQASRQYERALQALAQAEPDEKS